MEKEMHTIKEWARMSGLELFNYDGYLDVYFKLTEKENNNLYDYSISRFRDAGEMMCTREGFESGLYMCTMMHPGLEKLVEIADVLPGYAESEINLRIPWGSLMKNTNDREIIIKDLKTTLELLKYKLIVREKNINKSGLNNTELDMLDVGNVTYSKFSTFISGTKTVEEMEVKLINTITKDINRMLESGKLNRIDAVYRNVRTLSRILYCTKRMGVGKNIEEEFMFVDTPMKDNEPFVQTFNMYGSDGVQAGVVIDNQTDDLSGVYPISEEEKVAIDNELVGKHM